MNLLAQRISLIKPSPTLASAAKALEMKERGIDVLNLGVGEPDYDTPANIKEAAIEAINKGFTKYTAVDGIKELKEAVIAKFKRDNNLDYKLNEISVANGGKQIIYNIMTATLNPEDEVIIPSPYWVTYPDIVLLSGGKPIIINTKEQDNFLLSSHELEKAINSKTKWLIINYPSNPTGCVYTKEKLSEIAEIVRKHPQLNVLSDEIYEHITFDNEKFYSFAEIAPDLKDRIATVNGVAKAYSMTGWRIGYCGASPTIVKAMSIIQSQSTSNPCSISQKAALEALNGPQDFLKKNAKMFEDRRNILLKEFETIKLLSSLKPKGAFYLFINCTKTFGKSTEDGKIIRNADDFCNYLLEKESISLVSGSGFGMEGYFRMSYAVSDEILLEACNRIRRACIQLA